MTLSGAHGHSERDRRVVAPLVLAAAGAVLGLVATLAWAMVENAAASQERELTFGREAEAVQQRLIARVGELSTTFDSTLSFLGATYPAPPEVYADYAERQVPLRADLDPGVIFVEQVDRSQLDALEQREHEFGNTDFEIKTSDLYPDFTPALVVTRAGGDRDGTPFPYLGQDIVVGQQLLLPESFPDDGFVLRVTKSSALLSPAIVAGGGVDLAAPEGWIPEISPFFVGEVRDSDGQRVGWAVQFIYADDLADRIEIPDHVNVRLSVADFDGPIIALSGSPEPDPMSTELYEEREIVTASQRWSLEVWAGPEFGRSISLFAQTEVWVFGLAISAGLALFGWAWAYFRRRLAGATFELEHARTLATTDNLTGLLNRQGLIEAARQRPPDEEATLYFVDLDGFKSINDERGHEAGDAVLAAVAKALRNSFRQDDLVSRLGGDEFVVYTPGRARGHSFQVVADKVVDRIGDIDPNISCSLGIAHRPAGSHADVRQLLRMADEAMYHAKRSGGDRYTVSGPKVDPVDSTLG